MIMRTGALEKLTNVSSSNRYALLLVTAVLSSCSIKQDRTECPCYLDVSLARQAEKLFPQDKAWCNVWDDGNNIRKGLFSPVTGKDSTISCQVPRDRVVSVTVSNLESSGNRITAESGTQMKPLYISRQDVHCTGDIALVSFDSFTKQHINLTFLLNEEASPYRDSLHLTIESPYNGLSVPSMEPHRGTFRYDATFGREGKALACIPPQGGPGLKVGIRLNDNPPAIIDLYRTMLDAGFKWEDRSLSDFKATLGLNSVSSIVQITDWDVVELDGIRY